MSRHQKIVGACSVIVGGLSCLGTAIALPSGYALAQAAPNHGDGVPAAQDLLGTVAPQPAPVAGQPNTPVAPAPGATALPPDQFPPEVVSPRPTLPPGAASVGRSQSDASQLTLPSATPETAAPTTVLPSVDGNVLQRQAPKPGSDTPDYGSVYVDPTDYSLGATSRPDIVLSERSTGCKAVLRQGQAVPTSLCGREAGVGPSVVPGGTSTPEAFSPVYSAQVGPIHIGPGGISLRRLTVADYYNRTSRPSSLTGNGNTAMMFPLSIPAMITSPFGWRIHPIFGTQRMHTGTDLGAPLGTPVVAAYSGQVGVSDFLGGYGLTVVLNHAEAAAQTLYGHLSEVFVQSGEWVEQGDVIGRVGSTGNSTGPHLHFEYRQQTEQGWVSINSGDVLQQAMARIHEGFQVASLPTADQSHLTLEVPGILRSGKDATKPRSLAALVDEKVTKVWEP
ncbi:MAG: peptidoglycan DD-metalloendopeptidase family protein [Synechococcales bacterium]|nr:peptidoglycan DD-metalloendopeptidase family protein [Synechococcales bacterium]